MTISYHHKLKQLTTGNGKYLYHTTTQSPTQRHITTHAQLTQQKKIFFFFFFFFLSPTTRSSKISHFSASLQPKQANYCYFLYFFLVFGPTCNNPIPLVDILSSWKPQNPGGLSENMNGLQIRQKSTFFRSETTILFRFQWPLRKSGFQKNSLYMFFQQS